MIQYFMAILSDQDQVFDPASQDLLIVNAWFDREDISRDTLIRKSRADIPIFMILNTNKMT